MDARQAMHMTLETVMLYRIYDAEYASQSGSDGKPLLPSGKSSRAVCDHCQVGQLYHLQT